jgi:hypothetical protein
MTIKYRLSKDTVKGSQFFRSLTQDYPQLDWHDTPKTSYGIKCHWGQRKLMFSEIEFLALVAKKHDLKDFLVVYVGSACGIHLNIFKRMFPSVQWLLYDGAKFSIKPHSNFIIREGTKGFFTDDTVQEVLEIANGRKILFISDIRLSTNEDRILDDMLSQQRWAIMLDAEAIMLKMRLPYSYPTKNNARQVHDSIRNRLDDTRTDAKIKDKLVLPPKSKNPLDVLYLDGAVQLQLYAPNFSTETRLISFRDNGKYRMRYYDAYKYEAQMLYFNENDRVKTTFKHHDSDKIKDHIVGVDDGYESMAEYIIIEQYLQHVKKVKPTFEHVLQELYLVDSELRHLTKRSFIDCNEYTTNKYSREEKLHQTEKQRINSMTKDHSRMIQQSLQEQLSKIRGYIKNCTGILKKEQYEEQLKFYG